VEAEKKKRYWDEDLAEREGKPVDYVKATLDPSVRRILAKWLEIQAERKRNP